MKMLRLDTVGRAILILGLILLFFSSFGGLKTSLTIPAFLLIIGMFFTKPKNVSNQVRRSSKKLNLLLTMIGCLELGLLCYSSFLILQGLTNVQWDQIYYFSYDITPKLLDGFYGFPNFGFLLGLFFSLTLLAILIVDGVILGTKRDLKHNSS